MTRAAAMRAMDAAAEAGLLARQRCEACGAGQYPPGELCRVCLSDRLAWTTTPTAIGRLVAVAEVRHSFIPGTVLPQRVGLVQLGPGEVAVCVVAQAAPPGEVAVTARLDAEGRAVLVAAPC